MMLMAMTFTIINVMLLLDVLTVTQGKASITAANVYGAMRGKYGTSEL